MNSTNDAFTLSTNVVNPTLMGAIHDYIQDPDNSYRLGKHVTHEIYPAPFDETMVFQFFQKGVVWFDFRSGVVSSRFYGDTFCLPTSSEDEIIKHRLVSAHGINDVYRSFILSERIRFFTITNPDFHRSREICSADYVLCIFENFATCIIGTEGRDFITVFPFYGAADPAGGYQTFTMPTAIKKETEIVIATVYNPCDGYANDGMSRVMGLSSIGEDVSIMPVGGNPSNYIPRNFWLWKPEILDKINMNAYGRYIVCNFVPDIAAYLKHRFGDSWNKAEKRFLITMIESSDIPPHWPGLIHKYFDAVIVPCEHNKTTFEIAGVNIPVHVVPAGVDTDFFRYKRRSFPVDDGRPFRFICFMNSTLLEERKNLTNFIQAFRMAFGNRDDVELLIKNTRDDGHIKHFPKNIKLITKASSREEIRSHLYESDCMVFATHGEGYGRPPREAMATGLPVIVNNFAGLAPLCEPGVSLSVPFGTELNANYWNYAQHGKWSSPEVKDIAEVMYYAVENQKVLRDVGDRGAAWIREHDSIENRARHLMSVIAGSHK